MESENLETWLGVGVVGWLVLEVVHADLLEECRHHAEQIRQSNIFINDQPLHLVEFGQVSGVKRLIAENSVD